MRYLPCAVFAFLAAATEVTFQLDLCPPRCHCDPNAWSVACVEVETVPEFHPSTREVWLEGTRLSSIPNDAFAKLVNISHIYISEDERLRHLDRHSFYNLPRATHIEVRSIKTLSHIHPEAFKDLPNLKYLGIFNTGLISFPALHFIHSVREEFILEIVDNTFIEAIPANSFNGICENDLTLMLNSNGLKEIEQYAFNGSRVEEVYLNRNMDLETLNEFAFYGMVWGPTVLDLSDTRVKSLPSMGLGPVEKFRAKNTWALKKLPPLAAFLHLQSAKLTYPSHCCGLQKLKRWRGHTEEVICNLTRAGLGQQLHKSSRTLFKHNKIYHQDINYGDSYSIESFGSPYGFHNSSNIKEVCPPEGCQSQGSFYVDLPTEPTEQGFDYALCDKFLVDDFGVPCSPGPDPFNPCEDVMSQGFLRVSVWVVSLLAILANLLVLSILLTSHHRLSITRFLICNLAFADFCMGIYMLLIASVDLYTRSQYYRHAIAWQTGAGCNLAGALSIFACELSVYTLTAITFQRWHAIFFAMRPERKLRLRHAAALMLVGWLLCTTLALLPLLGVSSYQKVSICLPMDTETTGARLYVVIVLMINILAFVVVCGCYLHIYHMVHNPQHQSSRQDANMAKRMAVLIFTNFLCMAPISFYGLSAALHRPLITVTDSKILLVMFFPLNSCAQPFLYALLTRAFQWDVLMLLSRIGLSQTGLCRPNPMMH